MNCRLPHQQLIALLSVGLVTTSSEALVRRHDVADSALVAFAVPFEAVGKVGGVGDGTLIAPRWVLTAAHVAEGAARFGRAYFVLEGTRYPFDEVYLHPEHGRPPGFDLALVHLTESVRTVEPIAAISRAEFEAEVSPGRELILVGHGEQGRGNSPERAEDGTRRAGTNRVWEVREQAVVFFFDPPLSEQATPLEVVPGPGDSGGPALLARADGSLRIAAVSSAGAPGIDGPGSYEARDFFARIDTNEAWLRAVLQGAIEATRIAAREKNSSAARGTVSTETLMQHPAGAQLLALLATFSGDGEDSADLRHFAATRFANADPLAVERRTASLEALRQRFRGARIEAILKQTPDQIDLLLVAGETELILGARVTEAGLVDALFDGKP